MELCGWLLELLVLASAVAANISIERSLKGPGPEFQVFWNVPTFMCHRYGMDFSAVRNRWGIVQNTGDVFRGEHIAILYDPGEFPALLRDKQGKLQPRNGGVPQEGNLQLHLNKLRTQVDELVPPNFSGLGVIDFEAWRPIWRQNWASLLPYRDLSRKIEKNLHPSSWTPEQIEKEASQRFEKAAKNFMLSTLELLKQMRPSGQWGYYTFPYCFNYTPKNMQGSCPKDVQQENDQIQWLFDGSSAIYPSIYLSKERMTPEQHKQFAIGRMNEAARVAENVPRLSKPTVNAYIWYRYHDVDEFLSKEDLYNSLAIAHQYHAGGAVVWGSANDTNSREKCSALENYLNTVLGPTVKELSALHDKDLPSDEPLTSGIGSFFRRLVERLVGVPDE